MQDSYSQNYYQGNTDDRNAFCANCSQKKSTFPTRILFLIKYTLLFKQEANLVLQMFLLSDGMCSHAPAIES